MPFPRRQHAGRRFPAVALYEVCTLDGDANCLGCKRSLAEIAAWPQMSADEQWAIVHSLAGRRA